MPGAPLGRYELLMPIAQGGMAAVWAARQGGSRGFEKTVAIKTMLPKLSDDPQFERMFLNEATLATRIQHPNVAQILDLGEHGELLYIVMEWVDGEALSTLMRAAEQAQALLPRDIAVAIVERTCWGLHAAHEVTNENDQNAGIVHRDVSPQNILVAYNGAVKVVDFGVAKASGLPGGETNTGSLKGKVPYMSPEQAQCIHVDRRTDVFAIGILLYKLTTGAHPFVGGNDLETLQNIVSVDPVPPRQRDASISPQLEAVILRCMAKDRNMRFATLADVAHALDGCSRRVSEQEIAQLISAYLGPKGAQRRAQLKQAAKSLGWAVQTSDQMPQMPAQMGGLTPSHPSRAGAPWPRGDVQAPTPSGVGLQSKTFAAVASPEAQNPSGASTGMIALIAALAVAAVGAIVALGVVFMSRRADTQAAASHPTSDTVVNAAQPKESSTSLAVSSSTASATQPSSPSASASAQAATTAPATSASAAANPAHATVSGAGPVKPTPTTKGPPSGASGDVDMGF